MSKIGAQLPLSSIKMNLPAQLWGPCMAQPTVVPGPGALIHRAHELWVTYANFERAND